MKIEDFRDTLAGHGVTITASHWGKAMNELRGQLPASAVGSTWYKLGPALQKLYVQTPGTPAGFLLTETDDILKAVSAIASQYVHEAPVVNMPPVQKYVRQWGEIVSALDAAGVTKYRGKRQTPVVDHYRDLAASQGLNSRQAYGFILSKVLEGDEKAIQALRELLEETPSTAPIQ